mmetsp:Transcript_6003/g.15949  ORF Transcript_6003/g.15949 Transcript_6003/m.15949 type:complete len:152 (+) Transcript_6003:58-513(+)
MAAAVPTASAPAASAPAATGHDNAVAMTGEQEGESVGDVLGVRAAAAALDAAEARVEALLERVLRAFDAPYDVASACDDVAEVVRATRELERCFEQCGAAAMSTTDVGRTIEEIENDAVAQKDAIDAEVAQALAAASAASRILKSQPASKT